MALSIVFADPRASDEYKRAMTDTLNAIARASSLATRATAKKIKQLGEQDIQSAGQFGARWTQGLFVDAEPSSGFFINNSITVAHNQTGARNFEFGATILGRPILWVPLSFANIRKGTRAKDFPGGLFRVDRKGGGKPLLLSKLDKQPKFVGLAQVKIPKKWHLLEITDRALANDFPKFYNEALDVAG